MAIKVKKARGKVPPSAQAAAPAASNPLISETKLKQLYSAMLQCRILNEHARRLNNTSSKTSQRFGGEAAAVGAAIDLRRDDWLVPSQNDAFGKFIKGVPLASVLSGSAFDKPAKRSAAKVTAKGAPKVDPSPSRILPDASNSAARLRLASGLALALQTAKSSNVVMAFFGETSASGRRWQEALTFAGEHCLPLLVVVHGDASSKAASVHREKSSSNFLGEDRACGVPVIAVDAEDVVAIYRVAYESIHKARHGGGPTVILAVSLPQSPDGKSTKAIVIPPLDAIARMENYLAAKGLYSASWKQKLADDFNREVDSAIQPARRRPLRSR